MRAWRGSQCSSSDIINVRAPGKAEILVNSINSNACIVGVWTGKPPPQINSWLQLNCSSFPVTLRIHCLRATYSQTLRVSSAKNKTILKTLMHFLPMRCLVKTILRSLSLVCVAWQQNQCLSLVSTASHSLDSHFHLTPCPSSVFLFLPWLHCPLLIFLLLIVFLFTQFPSIALHSWMLSQTIELQRLWERRYC